MNSIKPKRETWEKVRGYFAKAGVAGEKFDSIDFEAIVDSSLSYRENINLLKAQEPSIAEHYAQRVVNVKELELEARQRAHEAERLHFREEEEKLLVELAKTPSEATLAGYFGGLELVTEAFAKSDVHALVVYGGAGLGKSFQVFRTLARSLPSDSIVSIIGHTTPLAFYKLLYENQDRTVVLDDVDAKGLRSDLFVAMLKAASWSATGARMVAWHSNSKILAQENVPASFEFRGKLVLLANSLPDNGEFSAFMSRALVKEVKFGFDDLRKLFSGLAALPFKDSTPAQRQTVVSELFSMAKASTEGLSLRTYVKAMELFSWDSVRWKDAMMQTMRENADLKAYYESVEKFASASERAAYFQSQTGKARASYFRLQARLKNS